MQVKRFSAPLGARIEGVDVRAINDSVWKEINSLFCEHKVLVFPDQELKPEDQMAFAQKWGTLVRHPYAGLKSYPDIIELKNPGKRKDINQHWHSDMTYNTRPPKLTMLYALETPTIGGDTAFANQVLAYDDLSAGLQHTCDDLAAIHSAAGLAAMYRESPAEAPSAEHPVVRVHDETGKRALYVCKAFTQRFRDWSRQESLGLLDYLYAHSIRPEYQGRHQWSNNDLVMWDNRSVLHFAVHDHADEPRRIHRLQVEGPVPG